MAGTMPTFGDDRKPDVILSEEKHRLEQQKLLRQQFKAEKEAANEQRYRAAMLEEKFGDQVDALSDSEYWAAAGVGNPGSFHTRTRYYFRIAVLESFDEIARRTESRDERTNSR